jgi:dTDP-4-amino-4,6-dideoxygalactose transaminase
LLGLTPVYTDIEEASQLASLESVLAALGQETALVVVTHLYGGVVDVPRLRSRMHAAGYGDVPIIEDCAQAHGVRLGNRTAGSMGDIATFSFYPTKNLGAFGDGGAIASSDPDLITRCRQLHQYGWTSKYTISVPYGRNSRMDEVHAAFLNKFLPGLDSANRRRVEILGRYTTACPKDVRVVRGDNGTVAHLAIVLCDRRDELGRHLAEHGVQSDIHYPVLDCDQTAWKNLPHRISPAGLPVSRASVPRLLTLPCFPNLTNDEVGRICEALRAWKP